MFNAEKSLVILLERVILANGEDRHAVTLNFFYKAVYGIDVVVDEIHSIQLQRLAFQLHHVAMH